MAARYPAMMAPKGSLIAGNDDRHNLTDDNSGGGPRDVGMRMPPAKRGGMGHNGQMATQHASMMGGRGSAGNPASRGGQTIHAMQPETRVPNHGGSPQHKGGQPVASRGGFGQHGQKGVPQYSHSQPGPGAGNTQGRSYRLIAGRFKRAAMGAKPSGGGGKYGSPPVSANT